MHDRYDAIVIGGGVNGCGVVRDLALRGLDVLLIEKGDFAMGTSWASSGMIHGGMRYLFSDVHTTYKSCKDAGYIKKIAPHLTFRIPLLMPILKEKGAIGRILLAGADALFALYDRFQPFKEGRPHLRFTPEETFRIEPLVSRDIIGSVITDEWGIDVPRLCILNVLDAKEHGADIRSWTEVTDLARDGDTVKGVLWKDRLTGETGAAEAGLVVNCGGPWASGLADMAGAKLKLRPAKGIHLILDRRVTNNGIIVDAIDGRSIFMIPHENVSMIGTTDDDYFGDPDHIPVLEDEIEYLLEAMEKVVPRIREARIVKTIAGVRPTLYERGKIEDDLTRDHRVFDHEKHDGVKGFISLAGGKLAAYRVMAEETADLACRKLGNHAECRTHILPLPGGDSLPDSEKLAAEYDLDPYAVGRIVYRHGSKAVEILEMIRDNPSLGAYLCSCDPVTEAEIRYAIRRELVRRAVDLIGRCRIAEGPCQGYSCVIQAAIVFGEEKGLSPKEVLDEALNLIQEKWRWRKDILSGAQMASEELHRIAHRSLLNYMPSLKSDREVY